MILDNVIIDADESPFSLNSASLILRLIMIKKLHAAGIPLCESQEYCEAIAESSRERKLLLVLIHSEFHPDAYSFLANVLTNPEIVTITAENFLIWASLVSSPEGFRYFNDAGGTTFPFLTINYRASGGDQVLTTLQGIRRTYHLKGELLDVLVQNSAILRRVRYLSAESKSRKEIRQAIIEEIDEGTHETNERR